MSREETRSRILATISAVLQSPLDGVAEVSRETVAQWDSLKHMEIMLAVEEELGVSFSEEQFSELASLDALVDAVQAHTV